MSDDLRLAYSVAETCKLLCIGRSTLYSAIKAGNLSIRKLGRRTLITREALTRWIASIPSSDDLGRGDQS